MCTRVRASGSSAAERATCLLCVRVEMEGREIDCSELLPSAVDAALKCQAELKVASTCTFEKA